MEALLPISLFAVAIVLLMGFRIVPQQEIYIVERLGKFNRTMSGGLNFIIPFVETIAYKQTLRQMQTSVSVSTKTRDNVFYNMLIAVQYKVFPEKVYESVYTLTDLKKQLESYIFDSVRSIVPKMDLDEFFSNQEDLANAIRENLAREMPRYGVDIVNTQVVQINLPHELEEAMNLINTNKRLMESNIAKGEAEKALIIRLAQADAEQKRLAGQGIANQRLEIVRGLKLSIEELKAQVPDTSEQEIFNLMMLTQYIDMLKHVGDKNTVLMLSSNPGALTDMSKQMMESIVGAGMMFDEQKRNGEG
jgi:regulator of protease activity HflC (stomatin/prohibitin superfamily)